MLTRAQRDKWAEELESGKWRQCRDHLRATLDTGSQGYCCLGVLYFGMNLTPEYVLSDSTYRYFTDLNDKQHKSFPEIAKHVRSLPVSDETQP